MIPAVACSNLPWNRYKKDRLAATKTINETMHVLSVLGRLYLGDGPNDASEEGRGDRA